MENFQQLLWQAVAAFLFQIFGDTVEAFGDSTGDAGEGVAIAAEGHGGADGILEGLALQEGCYG